MAGELGAIAGEEGVADPGGSAWQTLGFTDAAQPASNRPTKEGLITDWKETAREQIVLFANRGSAVARPQEV